MILKKMVSIILFGLLVIGCHSESSVKQVSNNKQLKDVINDYYSLEMNESWSLAYQYRTPIFKQSFTKSDYINYMKEGNNGWKLESFMIKSINTENNFAIVEIEFIENRLPQKINVKVTN